VRALALIREGISQVDTQVSEYEKATRQRDIAQRLEPKSQGQLKDGRLFSREDLLDTARTLLRDATVTLRASSGRLKGYSLIWFICCGMWAFCCDADNV